MRGEFGEGNPWQFAMGEAVIPTLNSMGVSCIKIEKEEDVEPIKQGAWSTLELFRHPFPLTSNFCKHGNRLACNLMSLVRRRRIPKNLRALF